MTATWVPPRLAPAIALWVRVRKRTRLGRPVSASCSGEALGDERLPARALHGDQRQGQQRQQHRRRVEGEDGQRGQAQEDALGGRLADELGGDLVAQAGAGGHRDGAGHEARVDDEEDERGTEDGCAARAWRCCASPLRSPVSAGAAPPVGREA